MNKRNSTARKPTAGAGAAKKKLPARARAKTVTAAKTAKAPIPKPASPAASNSQAMDRVTRQLRSWSDTALGMVGPIADISLKLAAGTVKASASPATIRRAGSLLRQARESAGLTVTEVAQAVNLRDAELLQRAESGKASLPFEMILRLAAVVGRHDPIPFAMKVTRSYNPELWQLLERLGIGKLAVHAGREREFLNVFRANDGARDLSEEEFAKVLSFVNAAFEMALAFSPPASSSKTGKTTKANSKR